MWSASRIFQYTRGRSELLLLQLFLVELIQRITTGTRNRKKWPLQFPFFGSELQLLLLEKGESSVVERLVFGVSFSSKRCWT